MYGVHFNVYIDNKNLQYVFTQKELNLRQRRWLKLLNDYDMNGLYHLFMANVGVDTLSRMTMGSVSHIKEEKKHIVKDVHRLGRLGLRLEDSMVVSWSIITPSHY